MNKIVFVEDDTEVGNLIAAWLGKHDFEVVLEPRGDRAQDVIIRENPDLVLLDILLPGKDGMTICRDLRPVYNGPIVLLTSLDSDMNHILALEMGANDYILKTTPPAYCWRGCVCTCGRTFPFPARRPTRRQHRQRAAFRPAQHRSDQS